MPGEHITEDAVIKKVSQFSYSFLNTPVIHIICKNEREKRNIPRWLSNSLQDISHVIFTTCHTTVSSTLNDIINSNRLEIIVVDDFSVLYSSVSLLFPFKNSTYAPSFVFGNIINNKINEIASTKLTLVDILTVFSIPGNLAFSRKSWEQIKGFDQSLDQKISMWDFTIRSLELKDNYALEIDAVVSDANTESDEIEN